ncbi:MAG: DUF2145 domain-containing protein [Noviherbaspirillum sp.]
MKATTLAALLMLPAASLPSRPAHAGRACEERPPTTQAVMSGMALAERTRQALDASGQDLMLLARAGQDLRKYGLRYSHLAFAYRQPDGHGGTVWRVLHKLNDCGSDSAAIYRQGLGQFFLSDPFRYEAAFAAPTRALQDSLLPLMTDTPRALAMHRRPYSMVSYVWSERYQQSNQWLLETMAAAMLPPGAARGQAQAWLQAQGYAPDVLRLGALERLGGRMSSANIAFDDHPAGKRYSGHIETVTADSAFRWLEISGLAGRAVQVNLR